MINKTVIITKSSARMRMTVTLIFCFIGVFPHSLISSSPFISRTVCITPTHSQDQQTLANKVFFDDHCNPNLTFELEDIVRNYTKFFTSNTKLQLLPGIHKVSESFGSIVISGIQNFTMIGSNCISDNVTTSERCCRIECSAHQNNTLGFAFINSTLITISNIQIANCHTSFNQFLYSHLISDHETYCDNQNSLIAAYSGEITIDYMTFEISASVCFIATCRLNISNSLHLNRSKIFISANNSIYPCTSEWQNYRLTNLTFISELMTDSEFEQNSSKYDSYIKPQGEFYNGVGMMINFHQRRSDSVALTLENITFEYQSLLLYVYRSCAQTLVTTIKITHIKTIGHRKFCYRMSIYYRDLNKNCYSNNITRTSQGGLRLENSQFIESSIEIQVGSCALFIPGESDFVIYAVGEQPVTKFYFMIKHVIIQTAPCNCDAALSVACAELTLESFTLEDSCCKGEAAVTFLLSNTIFKGSNYFKSNKRTCITSLHGTVKFNNFQSTEFSNNIADFDKKRGSTVIMVSSSIVVMRLSKLLFANNTGASCGGIMLTQNSRLQILSCINRFCQQHRIQWWSLSSL